jgi:sortase (surface protein transpeptidase)
MRVKNEERSGRHTSPVRRVRRPVAAAIALGGLLAVGVGAAGLAVASQTGHKALPVTRTHKSLLPPTGPQAAAPAPALAGTVAAPKRLVIPAIGVSTGLIHLGLTRAGTLQVPVSTAVAGWYTGSPRPGAIGSSVIGGHIDSYRGPGSFFRLRRLRPGNQIYVRRADGTVAVFRVYAVHQYLKNHFPTESVYGPTPDAQLRLITCGGTFDPSTGHYLSNVVVYATLAS